MKDILPDETLDELKKWNLKVIQAKDGYRFSVDSLLLVSLAKLPCSGKIIDLGSGCGVISFIVARTCPEAKVVGIEIQEKMVDRARRAAVLNGLDSRVSFILGDIKEVFKYFKAEEFDYAITNPPFWQTRSGRISSNPEEQIARFEMAVSLEDVLSSASFLLKFGGKLGIIYPAKRLAELIFLMKNNKLEPKRVRFMHAFYGDPAVFVFVEAQKGAKPSCVVEPPLFIHDKREKFSEEVRKMIEA